MILRKKTFFLLLILMALNHFSFSSFAISEQKSNLYFSENPITFDPPLIKKNNTAFIPIRSLVRFFDGTIQKSNITYEFKININQQILVIKPNKLDYKLNKVAKKFDNKPFMHKTRLYVPLKLLMKDLGYEVIQKSGHYYAYTNQNQETTFNKKKITFNYNDNASSNKISEMYLPISKVTLPITESYFNGVKKTDLTKFISYLGYSTTTIENFFILKKNNTVYSFKNASKDVKISINKEVFSKKLSYAPTIRNKRFYVKLKPFLNDLDSIT